MHGATDVEKVAAWVPPLPPLARWSTAKHSSADTLSVDTGPGTESYIKFVPPAILIWHSGLGPVTTVRISSTLCFAVL